MDLEEIVWNTLALWFMHVVLALLLSGPLLYLARNRVIWRPWEALIFVLPYAVWMTCMFSFGEGKSLANLGECFTISCIIPVAVLTRIVTPAHKMQWLYSSILIFAMCLVAIFVFWLTPPLPE
jgi:hypothetical protein